MWKKLISLSIVLVLALGLSVSAATYPGQLGVNLGGSSEAGGSFVDMAKEHHRYVRLPGGTMVYDSEGWPSCDTRLVLDFRLVAEWEGYIDDPEEYRHDNTGTYSCSFVGQADLAATGGIIQNATYNSGTNTTTFDFVITQRRVYTHIDFSNTKRTEGSAIDTGFTELKMIKPGYPAETTQVFTDDFINCLMSANFSTIRFSGVTNAWFCDQPYPDQVTWSERKLTTDAAQVSIPDIGKKEGVAWEYVIDLCNQVGMDPWINVPVSASTDYVTQLATVLKNNLNSNLNIYVESGNEVWNGCCDTTCYLWNNAQATALGIGEHENHARRAVELAQIFESVFGAGSLNNRVCVVLCSHAPMVKWWVQPMLEYINNTYGAPSDYIYAISMQTYFGAACSSGTVTETLDCCHDDITSQISETGGDESGRQQWVDKAAAWSLVGGSCSYEGGFHIPHGGDISNLDNQITMHRVERAGTELKYNYDDAFFALGANIAMQFTLQSSYHRYGCWGLTDDLANPDRNYKFQACRDLLGEPGPPGQATNPSPGNGETGVSTTADLSWTAGSGADSHDVYFGTATSPPFIQNQPETTYSPDTMAEYTTYYWRIDEKNDYGTTTGVLWSFTTGAAGCVPSTMHVDSITVSGVRVGGGYSKGRAEVVIVDNCGDPVSGALVSGTFTGDINESGSDTTDGNGLAVIDTVGTARPLKNLTFCVDSVTDTLTYNEADNVETCDSL